MAAADHVPCPRHTRLERRKDARQNGEELCAKGVVALRSRRAQRKRLLGELVLDERRRTLERVESGTEAGCQACREGREADVEGPPERRGNVAE